MMWNTNIPMEEAERCLLCPEAPCTAACPHGLDPAGLLRSVRFQNIAGAAGRLPAENPCAGCDAPCEGACLRPEGHINIRCPGHGDTSHAADMGIVQLLHPIQAVLQADYQSGNSFIRRQDIGSGSQNRQFAVQ